MLNNSILFGLLGLNAPFCFSHNSSSGNTFLDIISLEPLAKPFGLYSLLGGFIFGIGMMIAGGCGIGIFYRIGEGKVKSMVALAGLFSGVILYSFFYPLIKLKIIHGEVLLLDEILNLPQWMLPLLSIVIIVFWIFRSRKNIDEITKKTYLAGTGLGIINVLISLLIDNFYFIGNAQLFVDPLAKLFHSAFETPFFLKEMIIFMMILPIGVILGAFISARLSNEFEIVKTNLMEGLIGGLLVGIGAGIGLCCNYGYLTGISVFSVTAILGFIGIVLGSYTGLKIVALLSKA